MSPAPRSFRILPLVAALLMLLVTLPAASAAPPDDAGDACKDGGWQTLAPAGDPGTVFANQGDCVSYAVDGGALVAASEPEMVEPDAPVTGDETQVPDEAAPPEQEEDTIGDDVASACKDGGWEALAPAGDPTVGFQNQGDCVSYVAGGGKVVTLETATEEPVPAEPETPADSDAASLCKDGGWQTLAPAEDPTAGFQNQGDCVSHVVQGGTTVPVDTPNSGPGDGNGVTPCKPGKWDDLSPIDEPLDPFDTQSACLQYTEDGGAVVDGDLASAREDCAVAQAYSPDSGTSLAGLHLYGCDLSGHNLIGANLKGAILIDADLVNADLDGANLAVADLRYADLLSANLSGATLVGANLSGANLGLASFVDAIMTSANLDGAILANANLSSSNLAGADLRDADLSSAQLMYVNLEHAILINTNLSGADLTGANLTDAYLPGANFYQATCPDGAAAVTTSDEVGSCDGHLDRTAGQGRGAPTAGRG